MKKSDIYVFIDSQNLYLSIKELGWKLDYSKLYIFLKNKYKVSKIYIFIGYISSHEELYNYLKKIGYILVFKPTLRYNKSGQWETKGNVDAELVLHCLIEYNNFSQAAIISGDGDFYCLIEYLKNNNKLFKVGIPNKNSYSALLRKFADDHFYISRLRQKLEYLPKKRKA
jgi:uncharacterized LabA/DUF88 family protein